MTKNPNILINLTKNERVGLQHLFGVADVLVEPGEEEQQRAKNWLLSSGKKAFELWSCAALWYLGGGVITCIGSSASGIYYMPGTLPDENNNIQIRQMIPKIRTMKVNADEAAPATIVGLNFSVNNIPDSRLLNPHLSKVVRRIGLDEAPQLREVMNGTMALFGPRLMHQKEWSWVLSVMENKQEYQVDSESRDFILSYGKRILRYPFFKPSLIGPRTAIGGASVSYMGRLLGDVRYLQLASPEIDFSILIRSLMKRFRRHE